VIIICENICIQLVCNDDQDFALGQQCVNHNKISSGIGQPSCNITYNN